MKDISIESLSGLGTVTCPDVKQQRTVWRRQQLKLIEEVKRSLHPYYSIKPGSLTFHFASLLSVNHYVQKPLKKTKTGLVIDIR